MRTDRILAVDAEWTCWEGEPPPGEEREIIEIAVVEADPRTLEILRGDRYLVRPALSRVSPFCAALTGLGDAELRRRGRPLAEAMRSLAKAYGPASKPWIAWGDDRSGIAGSCRRLGVPMPFGESGFIDLAVQFGAMAGMRERPGLRLALDALGLGFEGRPHSALDDARNAMRVQLEIAARLRAGLAPRAEAGEPAPGPLPGPR